MQIHKFPLTGPRTPVSARGHHAVHAGLDDRGKACVWVEVHGGLRVQELSFVTVTDGEEFSGGEHVGSYVGSGAFVWHVYQEAAE